MNEEQRYRLRTPASARYFEEARRYLPGGDSRSTLFYPPYPAVLDRGEGHWVVDLDGNRLLDFTGNHSVLIHGYLEPAVMDAIRRQLEKGTCFPGPTDPQLRLARHLVERIASLRLVRFTNSGTEAVMMALRAARTFTGRRMVAKLEGGFHGTSEDVMGTARPGLVLLPAGDAEAAARTLEQRAEEIAALLVEPVQGSAGMIPMDAAFLRAMRETTRRLGIVLVFDEVVSFRVAFGGAEEHYGIAPDMTCLGKVIGGGLPLGAFGGREEIMALFDPSRGPPAIPHPGSYNANPVSLAAGLATLELLTRDTIAQLNRRGERLRAELKRAFDDAGVPAAITGLGSLFGIHLTDRQVRTIRDAASGDAGLRHRIFLGLYNEGILLDPRGVGTLSTAIGEPEIGRFLGALRTVLSRLGEPAAAPLSS
ncbi:MAG TPA: aspartate aminotransferase family protein [Gemmatimonadales bacterium]|nr:aspartate aminotransferase family protein [Gemmatimonadales bacterium]